MTEGTNHHPLNDLIVGYRQGQVPFICLQTRHGYDACAVFRGRVGGLIDSLCARINSEARGLSPPINEENALVNSTNLPLYRILNVCAAYSGPVVDAESDSLKDIVATNLVLNYLRNLIEQALIHAGISKHAGHPVNES